MCGIVGCFDTKGGKFPLSRLKELTDTISHRGPDSEGHFVDEGIALGHRRLTIIDLKTGDQPMYYRGQNSVVVFNGEIYNYLELKADLIKKNYSFKTESDTEVILAAYEEWGPTCVERFNGEWAFALWDSKENLLFISRDRYGIKPLYYSLYKDKFYFSSEIKTFKSLFQIDIDYQNLGETLVFGPKCGGRTFIKGVEELHPGNNLLIGKNKKLINYEYYSLEDTLLSIGNEPDIAEIERILIDSVKKRMIADVPLGTLNSGGIDSTLIMYLGLSKKYDLSHHTIYISRDYKSNVKEITDNSKISDDPSFYLHNPSVTDPTLAPEGHSCLYVLVPLPNNDLSFDWKNDQEGFRNTILDLIIERTGFHDLREHIEAEKIISPIEWEKDYSINKGAVFNLKHNLGQMLYFRPRNKFEEYDNCYLVGGGTHPGSGLPTIFESGRITGGLIHEAGQSL